MLLIVQRSFTYNLSIAAVIYMEGLWHDTGNRSLS